MGNIIEGKIELTNNDVKLLELLRNNPGKYKVIVDNDAVWVEDTDEFAEKGIVGDFSSYGDQLIVALFAYMNISVDYCW